MNDYSLKTLIPSLSSYCYLKEINNQNLLVLNKFIISNDYEGLVNCWESILPCKNINRLDKFFLLASIRTASMGNTIKVSTSSETEPSSTAIINIPNLLLRVLENMQTPIDSFNYKDMHVRFKDPTELYYKNFNYLLLDIVEDVQVKDIKEFANSSQERKMYILSHLKKEIKKEIKKHINIKQNYYPLIKVEGSSSTLANSNFAFYDNSCFFLLKFLYKSNISNIYNKLYHCCQKLNINYKDFCSLSPSETDLLLAIYKKNNSIK
jgi:hypothetical protein